MYYPPDTYEEWMMAAMAGYKADHLRLGSQRDNLQDAINKGHVHRDANGRYTHE